jgi:hypothetical protein
MGIITILDQLWLATRVVAALVGTSEIGRVQYFYISAQAEASRHGVSRSVRQANHSAFTNWEARPLLNYHMDSGLGRVQLAHLTA